MSLQAYQTASARAEDAKSAEYRLFGQVTRALMEAEQAAPEDIHTLINALDWNRRLWSVLASDCSSPDNVLGGPVRAQIISLSIWVHKHSSAVMRREEEIGPLVDINRIIMQGLAGGPTAAAA